MTIQWGAWEYAGSNGMRVGIEVSVESVTHSQAGCTLTVDYWTENQHTYGDTQTMNLGGTITGSLTFTNNDGETPVKRATRTYVYDYKVNEYGSSPGKRTFSANVSGTYNGVTPSASATAAIDARPYAAPANVTGVDASRISDESIKVSWVGHPTSGEPYQSQLVQRYPHDVVGAAWATAANLGGAARSFTGSVIRNRAYTYRVRPANSAGTASTLVQSNKIWTTPAAPSGIGRSEAGTTQTVSWDNNVFYSEYETQIWHAVAGVWDASPLHTSPAGDTSWAHTGASSSVKHSYRVRAKTTAGPKVLYSDYSGTSTESSGVVSAPSAPTGLSPSSDQVFDPAGPIQMSWTHNPTDGSAQRQFQIRHRVVGAGSWTTMSVVTSSASKFTLPGGTYSGSDLQVEWQVMTWGAGGTGSAFSASATFKTSPAVPALWPVFLDPVAGMLKASTTASGGGGSGPAGPPGPPGADGADGADGAAGTPGSLWYTGSGAPSGGLGIVGDWYLNSANGDYYEKTGSSAWTLRGNLKGATGSTGSTGSAGADGKTIRNGTVPPVSGSGVNGDFYIDTVASMIYGPRASGSWPSGVSMIGPTGATGPVASVLNGELLTVGETNMLRSSVDTNGAITTPSGGLRLTYFIAQRTENITQVRTYTGGTAAAGGTLCRYGIYSVDGSGNLTLVASCASDTGLWIATNTAYLKSLSATWAKVAGQLYASAVIFVGTTAPTLIGQMAINSVVTVGPIMALAPRLTANVPGQTDLLSTITVGTLAVSAPRHFMELIP